MVLSSGAVQYFIKKGNLMYSKFRIEKYLTDGIDHLVKSAMKASLKNPKESIFIAKYSRASKDAAVIRENYEKKESIYHPS